MWRDTQIWKPNSCNVTEQGTPAHDTAALMLHVWDQQAGRDLEGDKGTETLLRINKSEDRGRWTEEKCPKKHTRANQKKLYTEPQNKLLESLRPRKG